VPTSEILVNSELMELC